MGLTSLITKQLVIEPKSSTLLMLKPTTRHGPEVQFTLFLVFISIIHLQNSNASDWLCVFLLMVSYRVYRVRKSEKRVMFRILVEKYHGQYEHFKGVIKT